MWTQQVRENKLKLTIGVALIAMIIVIVTTWWYSNERALIALAKNVYWEALAANEPELSARMVARVTTERAKAKKAAVQPQNVDGLPPEAQAKIEEIDELRAHAREAAEHDVAVQKTDAGQGA